MSYKDPDQSGMPPGHVRMIAGGPTAGDFERVDRMYRLAHKLPLPEYDFKDDSQGAFGEKDIKAFIRAVGIDDMHVLMSWRRAIESKRGGSEGQRNGS